MDIYKGWIFDNGAYCLQSMGDWAIEMNSKKYQNRYLLDHYELPLKNMAQNAGIHSSYYSQCIAHPIRDEFWDKINLNQFYHRIKVPVLHLGGWYDLFLKSTLADWRGVYENTQDTDTHKNQWLCIGPADHEYTTEQNHRVGRMGIGQDSAYTRWEIQEQFFDYWLKDVDNKFDHQPRVKIFVMGANKWRFENEWPLSRTKFTRYYLHSGGNANSLNGDGYLDTTPPVEELSDRFIYDPLNPVTISLDTDLWCLAQDMKDRRQAEIRNDVLIYTTKELDDDLEVTGPIEVCLQAASTARDTDFTGTLVDVFPNGYAHLIQEGIIRTSYRNGDRHPIPIKPEEIIKYTIDLGATSHVFKKGHRLRVEISSSNFDRFDRNPNTGQPFAESEATTKATQTIFHSIKYPSYIILPLIE
jgi:putative CocE/NonD family hydrolase